MANQIQQRETKQCAALRPPQQHWGCSNNTRTLINNAALQRQLGPAPPPFHKPAQSPPDCGLSRPWTVTSRVQMRGTVWISSWFCCTDSINLLTQRLSLNNEIIWMARLTPQKPYESEQAPLNHCLNYSMVQLNVAFETSVKLMVWQVICTMFQHLRGKREWEQRQRPPICIAIYSAWVASKDTVGDQWEGMCQASAVKKWWRYTGRDLYCRGQGLQMRFPGLWVMAFFHTSSPSPVFPLTLSLSVFSWCCHEPRVHQKLKSHFIFTLYLRVGTSFIYHCNSTAAHKFHLLISWERNPPCDALGNFKWPFVTLPRSLSSDLFKWNYKSTFQHILNIKSDNSEKLIVTAIMPNWKLQNGCSQTNGWHYGEFTLHVTW